MVQSLPWVGDIESGRNDRVDETVRQMPRGGQTRPNTCQAAAISGLYAARTHPQPESRLARVLCSTHSRYHTAHRRHPRFPEVRRKDIIDALAGTPAVAAPTWIPIFSRHGGTSYDVANDRGAISE